MQRLGEIGQILRPVHRHGASRTGQIGTITSTVAARCSAVSRQYIPLPPQPWTNTTGVLPVGCRARHTSQTSGPAAPASSMVCMPAAARPDRLHGLEPGV
ncbi:MAG: hypothetical protein R3A10_08785 [Caldilineaceae bacterium]